MITFQNCNNIIVTTKKSKCLNKSNNSRIKNKTFNNIKVLIAIKKTIIINLIKVVYL